MIILGLGSNAGDRLAYLEAAVYELSHKIEDIRLSPIYETKALLPPGGTPEMDTPYLNMALTGKTRLTSHTLLALAKHIEQVLGRVDRGRWGPREIDVDILAMGDLVVETRLLCIPHPELLLRDFALVPLCDVAPDWKYPVAGPYYGKTAIEIAQAKNYALHEGLIRTELTLG